MKRTLLCLCLLTALCLSSCTFGDFLYEDATATLNGNGTSSNSSSTKTLTESELQQMINEAVAEATKNLTVSSGDSYNVTINTDASADLLAASAALLSTVSIRSTFTVSTTSWGRYGYQTSTEKQTFAGAGVFYKLDKDAGSAYIITNYHVVYYKSSNTENKISDDIKVYLFGMESDTYAIPATYVGGSMYYDIAVLKVSANDILKKSNAKQVTLADSNEISILETAIAIGNPEGSGMSATVGHINVDSEYISMYGADETTAISLRVMRVDAAVNGGNSGGGLYNEKGELIGIVNAKIVDDDVDNIGYAIPVNVAKYVADNILYYCDGKEEEHLYRCLVGITVAATASVGYYDDETGKAHIKEDVTVESVTAGGLADGVLAVGDVIRSITIDGNTYEVNRIFHVVDNMLNARVGSTVVFHVERGGATQDVTVDITNSALKQY